MQLLDALAAFPWLFILAAGLAGLAVGSFLNVVIHRLPIMMEREWRAQCAELAAPAIVSASAIAGAPGTATGCTPATQATAPATTATTPATPVPNPAPVRERYNLVVPRSACPACKAPITALQNIPVVSWLALRGRCAACGARISPRYPLVEALTGLLSALVAWKFGYGLPALEALVVTWFLIALAGIDIDTQLLPDSLTLPLLWLGLAASIAGPHPPAPLPVGMKDALLGAMAGYLSLWSVYQLFRLLTGKEGMGYGDFKLLAALGAWLGWRMLLPVVLAAAAVGAVTGIALIVAHGRDRAAPMAFGPFLAAAGYLVMMFGHELVSGYLGMFSSRM
ncbi:MAG TPA: A24 family peptidase [Steroidobacteraceae bacterium]|nr:A24 family peptidase [Steroidobacteraceae bacterium]